MNTTQKKIIIVDDEPDICMLLKALLEFYKNGNGEDLFSTESFSSGNECISHLKDGGSADLIISDIRMNNGSGIDLLQHINKTNNQTPLVFISGFSGGHEDSDLIKMGAKKVLGKPFKKSELISGIRSVLSIN